VTHGFWVVVVVATTLFVGAPVLAEETFPVGSLAARCDGTSDDTAAIQRAIDTALPGSLPVQISLPGGICIITAPLAIHRNAYLVGTGAGTVIRADFAHWRGESLVALDVNSKATHRAGIFASMHRMFSGFVIESVGQQSEQSTTAIAVHGAADIQVAEAVNHAFMGGFRDITIRNFDLGMDVLEMWNSVVDHVAMTGCRNGVKIHGKSVNLWFQHLMLTNFNNSTASTGFSIDSGFHYTGGKEGRPEGVTLSNSLVFGAINDVVVSRVLKGDIIDNILDGAVQTAVIIGTGDQVTLRNNYAYTSSRTADVVQVVATGAVTRGLNLIDNHVVASGGPGFHFVKGGAAREGVSIERNRFEGSSHPIHVQAGINNSNIRDNYGNRNTGPLISLESGGRAVAIDGNNSSDPFPAVHLLPEVHLSLPLGSNTGGP